MKRRWIGFMRGVTVLGMCCSLIAGESRTSHSRGSPPDQVEVHFKFQESTVSLHEPVVLIFEVHNGLSRPITVTVGALIRQYFDFSLTTPSGEVLHRDLGGMVDIVTIAGKDKVVVAPSTDYKEPLVMNQWFGLSTEGTYSLTSRLTSDIETEDGSFQAPSQTAQLRVSPRDPLRLNKICADRTRQVAMAPNAEAAQDPALKLSHIEDPVAVPYLAEVLGYAKLTDHLVIPALERIGTVAAVELLLSALDSGRSDRVELARQALARMQGRISNPALKARVQRALAANPERSNS